MRYGYHVFVLGLIIALSPLSTVAAQTAGPNIATIQATPQRYIDQVMTFSGRIDRFVDTNEFLLNDGSGQILVDAGPPWFQELAIPAESTITVTGEIDWIGSRNNRRGIELEACEIITPTTIITIRDCSFDGPPPWAGGPRQRAENRSQANNASENRTGRNENRSARGEGRIHDDDWYGIIEQRPSGIAGVWVIGGRSFQANNSTRLELDDGPLTIGSCASVDFRGNRALKIESEPLRACTNR